MMGLRRIHLEPIGGIAGDMFVAALADAFPQHRAALMAQLIALPMPVAASARFEPHRGATLVGTRFVVKARGANGDTERRDTPLSRSTDDDHHGHAGHGHTHEPAMAHERRRDHGAVPGSGGAATDGPGAGYHRHGHISHAWIVQWLRQAELGDAVRQHALDIFMALAEAEAAVHGMPVHEVEFHEVGSWDSIVDIVAAAFLIDAVGPARWTHGPLPLGGGTVRTAHGVMPVPAPATLHLLRGVAVVDDGVAGERVTPTGAAILKHLARMTPNHGGLAAEPMIVGASGLGFGARQLPDRPNSLRCTAFVPVDASGDGLPGDAVDCLEFEIDDQPAEDLAVGLDRLRERADVLQVFQMPVFGKKGRLASRIQVLARAGASDAVSQACFVETTTIGLRCQRLERRTLSRSESSAAMTGGAAVRVKVCERPGAATAKAEMDDLARQPGGHAGREQARRDAERQALASRPISTVHKAGTLDEH